MQARTATTTTSGCSRLSYTCVTQPILTTRMEITTPSLFQSRLSWTPLPKRSFALMDCQPALERSSRNGALSAIQRAMSIPPTTRNCEPTSSLSTLSNPKAQVSQSPHQGKAATLSIGRNGPSATASTNVKAWFSTTSATTIAPSSTASRSPT